jgi:Putative zinc-finger
MNQRIVTINDSIHEQVQKLLPWFVADSLKDDELALVNQHLNVCPACQSDFAWQCKLQAIKPASDAAPDVDRAFARLCARIDTSRSRPQPKPDWKSRFADVGFKRVSWMQWALAAQFIAILVLVLTGVPGQPVGTYRALGAGNVVDGNLIVMFKPDTTELSLRGILNDSGARIVDGPTVTDAYVLHVDDDKLAATLQRLRAEQAISLAVSLKGSQ